MKKSKFPNDRHYKDGEWDTLLIFKSLLSIILKCVKAWFYYTLLLEFGKVLTQNAGFFLLGFYTHPECLPFLLKPRNGKIITNKDCN